MLGRLNDWPFIMTGEILANNMKSYIFAFRKWVCNPPMKTKTLRR